MEVTEADGGVVEEGAAKDVEMNDISASLLHQKTLLRSEIINKYLFGELGYRIQ